MNDENIIQEPIKEKLCIKCGAPHTRKKQKYCFDCHAAYMRTWRRERALICKNCVFKRRITNVF